MWDVPSTLLCGRYSFSIAADMVNRYNYGQIWSIPCPSTSATVIQTTACSSSIPSPTGANPFLVPNADNYPFRVGKEVNILWNPTTSGSVSIRAYSSSSTQTTTIAGKSLFLSTSFKGRTCLACKQTRSQTRVPLLGLLRPISRARQALPRLAAGILWKSWMTPARRSPALLQASTSCYQLIRLYFSMLMTGYILSLESPSPFNGAHLMRRPSPYRSHSG